MSEMREIQGKIAALDEQIKALANDPKRDPDQLISVLLQANRLQRVFSKKLLVTLTGFQPGAPPPSKGKLPKGTSISSNDTDSAGNDSDIPESTQ